MVKARESRAVKCIREYQELRQMLRPFVFRRYIDFSAIQSLRRMKSMIGSEVRRRGLSEQSDQAASVVSVWSWPLSSLPIDSWGREPSLRGRGLLETLSD